MMKVFRERESALFVPTSTRLCNCTNKRRATLKFVIVFMEL